MSLGTGARIDVADRADVRSRLLGELAAAPARKGYGIAYDLLGNRAEHSRTLAIWNIEGVDNQSVTKGRNQNLFIAEHVADLIHSHLASPAPSPGINAAAKT